MSEDQSKRAFTRCAQIFSAKIVLEVFGGGGAIWGASEIVTFRNPQTVNFWRPCAAIFGAIFFVRYCLQMKDFINQYFFNKRLFENVDMIRFLQIFSAKFVLEVCGGGGAVWGSMEALGIRNPETQDFWRFWSSVFLCIFLVRFVNQAKDYLTQAGEPNVHPWVRLIQIFSAKFVLEVLGGAGAIWGWSEVITFRNEETVWLWRPISLTFGVIFLCRWFLQILDYVAEMPYSKLTLEHLKRMYQIFSAKLVLEVFGGAGAIWGFSEAVGLRNPSTVWFWRPCALVFGVVFFYRWLLQINDFLVEKSRESPAYEKTTSMDEDTALTEDNAIYGSV